MKLIWSFFILVVAVLLGLFLWTRFEAARIALDFPPSAQFAELSEGKVHYSDLGQASNDEPPVLFVHGASGNLLDQQRAYERALDPAYRMIFVDRPGYGYSDRAGADTPAKQAAVYRELLDYLEIDKVVLVGHSLGTASVAAFAVLYPERVKGLVFVSPATHPWPGGVTWYYEIASLPVVGEMFTETVVLPAGINTMESGATSVFSPQEAPADYVRATALPLILRPFSFRNNADDVAGLNSFVQDFSKRYSEIMAPTVIITGDKDDIVAPEIHSTGLERDIKGAELVVIPGMGHKPDYRATDKVVSAIEKVMR